MAYFRTGGGGGEIPAFLKTRMNAVLNKKFGTAQTYEPNKWPDDVNLLGVLEEKTVSAAPIASFSDGADDVPIADGEFLIDYNENGVSSMNIRQTGVNLLDDTKRFISGVITSFNTTGVTGVAIPYLPAGDYTLKIFMADGKTISGISMGASDGSILADWTGATTKTFTLNNSRKNIYLWVNRGSSNDSDLLGAMLTPGTTAQNYESFVSISDKTVDFDGHVVYGGSYNSTIGVLTSTKAADGSNLPDPVEYQIDPTIINSLLGANNIYSDVGNTAIVYRSSGTETIIQPTLISKTITENGTYSAADDDADGYSDVTVNVPQNTPLIPQFTETKIADNTAHAATFTLTESYNNYDMVKIVWYESSSSRGVLFTTPDILDEIFDVSTRVCINKPKTNMYVCYSRNGLTWTQTNQRTIFVHEIYGVTFTNCTMTLTDLYKRGAVTTSAVAITSQTSLKDFDFFIMSSIHNSDGSETMPSSWFVSYPYDFETAFDSMVEPCVLEEYNRNDETFNMTEFGMTAASYFMVQGVKLTAV